MDTSTKLALAAVVVGGLLSVLLVAVAGTDEWVMYAAVATFVYSFALIGGIMSQRVKALRVSSLLLGIVPLFLWTVAGTLGAGDPTPIVPLFLYVAAVIVAFKQRRRGTTRKPGAYTS